MPPESQTQIGRTAPDFELPAIVEGGDEAMVRLSQYRGSKVVLFFYPKDMTPACTQESCDFRDAGALLSAEDSNTVILGISTNDLKSHRKFADKYNLGYPLLADVEHKVCEQYGVWQEKKLYGRAYMGIVRSTFLIDENGKLLKEWRSLKVKGHVDEVVETIRALRGSK
ncbi:peroxiredoxin [Cohnella lubricantis]|uniref:thioredoxin-dependent peroxiredoxin n=1 Tax=Cohnella lubricantis TaxID=2163172 RepID=A0A841TFZ4_9BACL|nr:peroxiredoxin [Cohnella lubricantis]MBB6679025.1 peroxiredoxin [Cohnella lubricantis]MBP2119486.1 peroxiredoxin Q/BCP [Cohnella lubricantis]